MKVIIIANTYWNILNFRQPIIEMLEKKGAEVYISAPFSLPSEFKIASEKNFIKIKHARNPENTIWNALQNIAEYRRIFQKIKPDLILLYTMKPNVYGNIAAAFLDIPVISTVTGLGYTFIKGGLIRFLSERLYKFAFRKTKHIIFHNPDDKQLFVSQGFALENRCQVIRGSGVDIEKFQPQEKLEKLNKFIFIFVGRLLVDKGIQEYLSAAKRMEANSTLEFHIVGELYPDNPASLSEKEWFLQFGNSTNVIWHKKQEDVRPFLAAADCMVLPSYREGLPMSILEAMAMEKPIITTDVPGCRETVGEGINGFLVPVKNSEDLENAMLTMVKIPESKRFKMGRYSREKAIEEFSSEIVSAAYEKLIDNIE